nr:GntR family transcriptional regulator [uncultured Dorea sp.]
MTVLGYKTLRESIVDIIRKRIINRELQPGQKIVEQELAKEFKTSRAPIREALRELENEGLVEYVRNAGCSVKEITFEESFEIYLMRANYEIMAVRLLGGKIPEETLQEMEEILERMKNLDVDEYDQLFSYDSSRGKEKRRDRNKAAAYNDREETYRCNLCSFVILHRILDILVSGIYAGIFLLGREYGLGSSRLSGTVYMV